MNPSRPAPFRSRGIALVLRTSRTSSTSCAASPGTRFLAVVGSCGRGKSSLVRAGLLPALYRGYLAGSTTNWRIAVMRPGTAPLDSLYRALSRREALGTASVLLEAITKREAQAEDFARLLASIMPESADAFRNDRLFPIAYAPERSPALPTAKQFHRRLPSCRPSKMPA